MTGAMAARALDVDLLVRELGNWRTSSRSGPAYHGLADAIRLSIVDGRLPVGARLPSERALADALHVSRTTVTAAYTQMRDDGYLNARRGARSTTALPVTPTVPVQVAAPTVSLAAAALSAPASAVMAAFAEAAIDVTPYLQSMGHELVGTIALRQAIAERYCERGLPTEPDEVMVTTGALHAIGLILTTYIQPGDRVLVEQPTYHGALSAITTAGARPVPVSMTEHGWDLDAVEAAVHQLGPEAGLPDSRQPQPDRPHPARSGSKASRAHHHRDPNADDHRRDHRRYLARPTGTTAVGRRTDGPTRSGADGRFDVEVVLGRAADRLDPCRAEHHRDPGRTSALSRHGYRDTRTARGGKASRTQ